MAFQLYSVRAKDAALMFYRDNNAFHPLTKMYRNFVSEFEPKGLFECDSPAVTRVIGHVWAQGDGRPADSITHFVNKIGGRTATKCQLIRSPRLHLLWSGGEPRLSDMGAA